jgi:hypothetical protein
MGRWTNLLGILIAGAGDPNPTEKPWGLRSSEEHALQIRDSQRVSKLEAIVSNDSNSASQLDECECTFCSMHGAAAPRLFVQKRFDGEGAIVNALLQVAAHANSLRWSFGGVDDKATCDNGADIAAYIDLLFGNHKQLFHQRTQMEEITKQKGAVTMGQGHKFNVNQVRR